MNSIGNIAKGIFIGDGALAAFKEISRNKGIKSGLFDKTTDSGVRKHNTNNNFPRTASYYYTLQKLGETPMEFKRFFFGNLVSGDNIDGLDIGWAYTTDVNQTRIHGGSYASSADFDKFQRLLRNNALTRGTVGAKGQNIHIATRYADYDLANINYEIYDEDADWGLKSFLKIGDMYSTNKIGEQAYRTTHNVLQTQTNKYITKIVSFKDKFGIHRYSTAKQYGITTKNDTPVYYKISDNLKDNKLKEDFKIDTSKFGVSNDSVGLLKYTENLFRNCKINSLVNRFHTNVNQTGEKEQLSRGRNLKSQKGTTIGGYDNPYCRVWTAVHQYSKMKDVIRPFYDDNDKVMSLTNVQKRLSTSMRPNNSAEKLGKNSVLQDNGFVRITPQITNDGKLDIHKYMFSIENLAWRDKNKILTKEQLGPNKGRIMWFPPYNLKFSENINVNWNGNNFIGRGEQIYTYTNTERSGTLDFTLLIDHPSILNEWRGSRDFKGKEAEEKEQELLRFFAGCGMLNKDDSIKEINLTQEEEKPKPEPILKFDAELIDGAKRVAYIIFYPNDYPRNKKMTKDTGGNLDMLEILKDLCQYETSDSGEYIFAESGTKNENKFSLNLATNDYVEDIKVVIGGDSDDLDVKYLIDDIIKEKITESSKTVSYNTGATEGNKLFNYDLTKYDVKHVEYHSTATNIGNTKINKELQANRLTLIKELLKKIGVSDKLNGAEIVDKPSTIVNVKDKDGVNSKEAKYGRIGLVIISLVPKTDLKTESEPVSTDSSVVQGKPLSITKEPSTPDKAKVEESVTHVVTDAVSRVDNEFLYFTEISKDEKIIQPLLSRIRHFDPAFHSLTPEGFNARLTFLQQCTRQGPTAEFGPNNSQGAQSSLMTTASNLSFGRAPYCILRIGDFFNTKICIDSISINYDNGGGPQWDLNPEGAGVQPMFANVSINFKFLGGQDIAGPVEKLQNAITSNYYANASVYDVNAENGENKK